jgi:phycoerythrin-associated linker protein
MVKPFISPTIAQASQLGVSPFEDTDPIELWPNRSTEEVEIVIRAVYRQVLGNAYVMESERLTVPESQLKQGQISVREFVSQVAKSELYRSRFFDNCPRYRAIELNFKHLLGRAPESYEEMATHSEILDRGGFEAEIDSYIDSDEYQDAFGDNIVPYYRGYKTQTGKRMVGFTHLFQLLRGASSSDKRTVQGNYSRLSRAILADTPSAVVPPSSVSSYGGMTDVNKLLAEVLKPKPAPQPTYQDYLARSQTYQSLQRQFEEQAKLIATLQEQVAELRSVGAIGQFQLNKWQSTNSTAQGGSTPSPTGLSQGMISSHSGQPDSFDALQRQVEQQDKAIAALRQQIAELRSLAAIGEAQLNKWRSRSFSR